MKKRHEIGKMVWVEVRNEDMVDVVLPESQFGQTIRHASPEVEDDAQAVTLDESGGSGTFATELTRSRPEKSET